MFNDTVDAMAISSCLTRQVEERMEKGEYVKPQTDAEKKCYGIINDLDHIAKHVDGSKTSKKSSRFTCFGTTQTVSISDPGPWTPKRYDPKVKIVPPAALAATSDKPRMIETLYTNLRTNSVILPRTNSLYRDCGVSFHSRGT